MAASAAEAVFPPFPFNSRSVPIVTDTFDLEQWKREPTGPFIVKNAFSDWPLFRALQERTSDDARLDYLSSAFGNVTVGYTKVPPDDPFMGYDENGEQNFEYAPATCRLDAFCSTLRATLRDPSADVLYARGGANSVRTWRKFSQAIRPLEFLRGMEPNGEGIWLGSGRHISYLHQDAHFNFFAMLAGVKRVLLYPLEAIADLYPTPFYGGIAGTTSSFVRPLAPDPQRFPRFKNAAKHAWTALLEEGDLLCLPPCWWHYVEAAPGLNLMINTFVWALAPRSVREFEIVMRNSIRTALTLSTEELSAARKELYRLNGDASPATDRSRSAAALARQLRRFLTPEIPAYWQRIARCYYDHYVFRVNGEPVPTYPERHVSWVRRQCSLEQRCRLWLRFNRDLARMAWLRKRATGVVP
jgi:hypothetical protein